jgi:hypothetical protein
MTVATIALHAEWRTYVNFKTAFAEKGTSSAQ